MAITLVVTAKGQINLCNEVLDHLRVSPGGKLAIDLLPGGRLQLRPNRGILASSVFGMLAKLGTPQLSIEKIIRVSASGWTDED